MAPAFIHISPIERFAKRKARGCEAQMGLRRRFRPWTETDSAEKIIYSIYATYTAAGGGAADVFDDTSFEVVDD